ncbi:MAG TPA: hypothetical protein PKG52_03075 [bacterium]|nr:hypothetical protein [bacterium]HPS30578.1 hypothetical protein [bacterium]
MKEKIKLFLTEYSREKLLALFLTIVVYTLAIDINHESKTYSVKVNVVVAEDQIITSDPLDFVQVKVKGSVFDFATVNEKDLFITFDLSTKKPGKFTRFFDAGIMPFGEKIRVEKIIPSEIVIRTAKKGQNDKKASVRN